MSTFSFNANPETGSILFNGELSLNDFSDWNEETSSFFHVFMKTFGKNKLSTQLGALSLLFEALENQDGTEIVIQNT